MSQFHPEFRFLSIKALDLSFNNRKFYAFTIQTHVETV